MPDDTDIEELRNELERTRLIAEAALAAVAELVPMVPVALRHADDVRALAGRLADTLAEHEVDFDAGMGKRLLEKAER